MPDIGGTIRDLVLADGTVSGITTRMFSDALPQTVTLPAIMYFVVDTEAFECLTGIEPIAAARIQIDCYAVSRPAVNVLGHAVRLALEKGQEGAHSGNDSIYEINLDSGERHTFDRVREGSDQRRYITSQDFMVHYVTTTS